jgi:enoyl-[acyl-carrier protein] reductase III
MIPGQEALKERSLNQNPFKRLTTPEDIANVLYLLCKDEAAWINGSIIVADGGEHIN